MPRGLIDADLGGWVYKKRVPVPGRGKRGGARTIIGSNLGVAGSSCTALRMKDRETIDARELAARQAIAAALLALDPKLLAKAVIQGELEEIGHEEKSPAQ
jgi:hypothetical protein